MMQLNMNTVVVLTKLFMPDLLATRGKILNTASTAAFQPGPYMAVYYATKSFVLSFSEAIASELEDTGVTVTALCPGPTASGFQDKADLGQLGTGQGQETAHLRRSCRVGLPRHATRAAGLHPWLHELGHGAKHAHHASQPGQRSWSKP
jgi:short-subunit dehydrogenase